ncbi:MAG: HupE/UreJ family protein, partial [Planctomycetes bacterium]|nr:HupE/UreJ family protein [Planctomycetota bacterium]
RLMLHFAPAGRLPRGTTVIVGATLTWHGQRLAPEPAASDGTVAWSLNVAGQGAPVAARWSDLPGFFRMGFLHIVPEGIDHILFVLGLFLLAPGLRPLLVQITAFTLAHSLTLGLAMAGIFELPARIVEPLIALSIVAVAVENIFVRKLHPWRWAVVFLFGLVHGLGFAGALRGLHLPTGGILMPLLGFNLGVEAGQLSIVAAATLLTVAWWRRAWYPRYVLIPASAVIAAVGLFWAVQRGLGLGIEA